MKSYLNIERRGGAKRTYRGYGGGAVWIIKRYANKNHTWKAVTYDNAYPMPIFGANLDIISKRLEVLDHAKQHLATRR